MPTSPSANRLRKLIPSLGVSDLRRSLAFYREFFGFEPVDSAEDDHGVPLWVWLRSGVAELMLQQLDADAQITLDPALGHSWVLYLRPADLQDTRDRLNAAGVEVSEVESTAYGARECFARDPDGYPLWLSEPDSGQSPEDEEDEEDGETGEAEDSLRGLDAPDEGELDEPEEGEDDDPDEGRRDERDEAFGDPDDGETGDPGDDPLGDGQRLPGPGDRVH